MIRGEIKKIIQNAIKDLQKNGAFPGGKSLEIKIEYPADSTMGDYATNIAFVLAKTGKNNPQVIAQTIAEKVCADKKSKKMFKKIEAAGAGFINFTLSPKFLQQSAGRRTSQINVGRGRKLNIEFLSANPTGKFQVGNGRIGFYGDVLGNIFKLAGYKVTKEYYINNAKSSNQIQELGKTALGQGEKYSTPYIKEKIAKLTGSDPVNFGEAGLPAEASAKAGFLLAEEIQKDNQEFLRKIGIHYDVWTREEEDLVQSGLIQKTLEFLKKKGLVYEKDGAQWLKTTKFGDDKDKVIVRSNGESHSAEASRDRHGYYLADIAYHRNKIRRGYKVIIDIFGADHQGHVEPMKVAMKILGYSAQGGSASGGKGKFDILVSQLVRAKGGGKFSKRAGNIVLLEDLIDEVGVDAARFFYLMKSLDTQMEFDMDLAKEQSEKNPVYYVQYAHARMNSIILKARSTKHEIRNKFKSENSKLIKHQSELNLIKQLLRWPEVVEDTASDYQIQRVTGYAHDLATVFSQFYRDCKVISEDKKLTEARLGLVVETQKTLREVLGALGITAPEEM